MSTVTHTFPERRGYTVTVNIEDSEGCVNTNAEQKELGFLYHQYGITQQQF